MDTLLSLEQITQQIEAVIDRIDLSAEVKAYELDSEHARYLTSWKRDGNEYYKALAALVNITHAEKVLDLGTYLGASAVALSKFAQKVITVDINLQRLNHPNFYVVGGKIEAILLADEEACLGLPFNTFPIVFVDLDANGTIEKAIHQTLTGSFYGIAAFDDIQLNAAMREFWESVDLPKIACNWHHSGFGLVDYRGQR